MKFCWTTITVNDMKKSLAFYEQIVGLKVHRQLSPVPGTEIAFLGSEADDDGTEVELIYHANGESTSHGRDISLGFVCNSVDARIEDLKTRGITNIEGPFQPNPHIRFIYLEDPDGVRIQFVENIP